MPYLLLLAWLALISLVAIVITVADKRAARFQRRRVPEATLLWIGFFGGAAAMLFTMKHIRHKTRKRKFMIGLPFMIIVHIAVAVLLWLYIKGVVLL